MKNVYSVEWILKQRYLVGLKGPIDRKDKKMYKNIESWHKHKSKPIGKKAHDHTKSKSKYNQSKHNWTL